MSVPEIATGARKRTPVRGRNDTEVRSRVPVPTSRMNFQVRPPREEEVTDSGLSSESTTPVGGSPQRTRIMPHNVSALIAASRARLEKTRISSSRTSRLLKSRPGTDSPKSLDSVRSGSKQVYSPLRTSRNVQSPSIDSGDEGSLRMDRGTYQYMSQDIVCIKTMLLKLKRILQESGENSLTRAEPLNPFDNTTKNGLLHNLNEGDSTDASTTPENGSVADELADLRRQVVFLQGQLEDKDRTIQSLQLQLIKYQGQNHPDSQNNVSSTKKETCNSATQTEKMRPISAGPSLLQSLPQDGNMGPLVSWNNSWDRPKPPVMVRDIDSTRKSGARATRLPHKDQRTHQQQRPWQSIFGHNDGEADCETVAKNGPSKPESPSPKSAIPTPRRLATPTLIPRAGRAISATGRSQNGS